MTGYLAVWHSHCTRARFTVLVSCSDELAVYSSPFLHLQRQNLKLRSGLFCYWSLFSNNNMATNLHRFASSYGQCCYFSWFAAKRSKFFSLSSVKFSIW